MNFLAKKFDIRKGYLVDDWTSGGENSVRRKQNAYAPVSNRPPRPLSRSIIVEFSKAFFSFVKSASHNNSISYLMWGYFCIIDD